MVAPGLGLSCDDVLGGLHRPPSAVSLVLLTKLGSGPTTPSELEPWLSGYSQDLFSRTHYNYN